MNARRLVCRAGGQVFGVEARVLEFLREQRPMAIVDEETIARALDIGDALDVAAALYMLQAAGEVRKMPVDGGHGWMLLV